MDAYKFLRPGAVGRFSGFAWPMPHASEPGPWIEVEGELALCEAGIHACRLGDLPYWLDEELWAVELGGEIGAEPHAVVARRGRLVRRIDAWTRETARDFGKACMMRTRDHAVEALRAAGLPREAERLAATASTGDVEAAGLAAVAAAGAAGDVLAERVAYAAVTSARHAAVELDTPTYIAYPAFAAYSATVAGDSRDSAGGWDAERAWQADWLAARLDLE